MEKPEEEEKRYPPRSTGLFDINGEYLIDEGDGLEITNKDVPAHTTRHIVRWIHGKFMVWSYISQAELTPELIQKLGLQIVSSVEYLLESEREP